MGTMQPREFALKTGEMIVVRSGIPEDTKSLLELAPEVLREGEFMITELDEFQVTEEQEQAWLQQHQDDPGMIMLLAFSQTLLVGYLNFACEGRKRRAHLGKLGMAVRKEWRSTGVGRALLQSLLDWAKDNPQVEKVCLEVFANNSRAIHLYQSLGFVEEGRVIKGIKIAPEHYIDLVLMATFVK